MKTLFLIAVMLLSGIAGAQMAKLPDAPRPTGSLIKPTRSHSAHTPRRGSWTRSLPSGSQPSALKS